MSAREKAAGTRSEIKVRDLLPSEWSAVRVDRRAGQLGAETSHDLEATIAGRTVAIEVKRRRGGDKQLRAWMPPAGIVVTDEPRAEPIVHLPISTFIELTGGGND